MFVSFRKCSRPQKPDPISDCNCQNLYPFSDQNGPKTIPFGAAHTYIPYIGEYPPPPGGARGPAKLEGCLSHYLRPDVLQRTAKSNQQFWSELQRKVTMNAACGKRKQFLAYL